MSMFSLSKGPSPPANDIPPAIEFVESCIHSFSKTADSGIRCAGTLRSIVLRVQSICAHIQKLITESEENHDWSMTISIASQIEYLEGLLTRISRNLHEEVEASFPSPCNDIQHCLYSIRAWHSNRQTFRDVSMKLQRRPFEVIIYLGIVTPYVNSDV
ncbi:hypothetical protein FRC02_011443 [Tulasnella sp. 418]|nr:hypothetical protein FRC02_011443 [Tulasnella sp. 418]